MTHPNTTTTPASVEPFYTPEEAGAVLRIGRSRIYEELRRCRLRSVKVGRSRRIPAEWLNEYRTLLITEGSEE
ncbi:excisionase family DNA-binding protein [Glycomyces sp. L485]|uniref:excisionase family DNA-binding protein n=1 Tax=Glycomyces sp. L485 TaxID=2909235 RepID=UPI001F4AF883|nr:excisionase family DNA-binding protein [Glycomyces sp. L485]MCH7230205.1 excisionase family DNA-binding protein [Glycomyces sp. L485]